jgi:hypothetical protein
MDDPIAGGGAAPPTPKSKQQKRMMYALGAAGVLALVVLLTKGQSADATDAQGTYNQAPPPIGSTFADNGEAAGALGDNLSTVTGQLSTLGDQLQTLQEGLGALQQPAPVAATDDNASAPADVPAPVATAPGTLGANGGSSARTVTMAAKVAASAPRAAQITSEKPKGMTAVTDGGHKVDVMRGHTLTQKKPKKKK